MTALRAVVEEDGKEGEEGHFFQPSFYFFPAFSYKWRGSLSSLRYAQGRL
jgi:hypothetical protein